MVLQECLALSRTQASEGEGTVLLEDVVPFVRSSVVSEVLEKQLSHLRDPLVSFLQLIEPLFPLTLVADHFSDDFRAKGRALTTVHKTAL